MPLQVIVNVGPVVGWALLVLLGLLAVALILVNVQLRRQIRRSEQDPW